MAKTNTKDASTTEAIRKRKSLRKKMEKKGMLAPKLYTPEPWPAEDRTPRNGMCNLPGGKFETLPNKGKKMFNWVKTKAN